jgi:hypothetical protein
MHTDGWRPVAREDGSSSSSDPDAQGLTESLNFSPFGGFGAEALPGQHIPAAPRRWQVSRSPRCF